ncbi:hypothetical protein [Aliivibrio sifiae]|uniref:Inner membrane protein n=1 Tax=Aliivibrio sifiae TaxID=566293 RepID=A0A2S7X7E9_9GAMM|nr:hypothetical protein [Aliivibrio sifiae]PQJ87270.1 hypothetical protein BTO23_14215 [Aliivibrio sifiae]GLR76204.1 hypothetical protein GCM10007855_30790 [Aliivibrio sifiae]
MWRTIIVFLAYWIMAAHFLREGNVIVVSALVALPFTLFFNKEFVFRMLQAGLVIGVFAVWLPTIYHIAEYRLATEQPWIRMAVIMSSVILFNLFCAWNLNSLIKQLEHRK